MKLASLLAKVPIHRWEKQIGTLARKDKKLAATKSRWFKTQNYNLHNDDRVKIIEVEYMILAISCNVQKYDFYICVILMVTK